MLRQKDNEIEKENEMESEGGPGIRSKKTK